MALCLAHYMYTWGALKLLSGDLNEEVKLNESTMHFIINSKQ